MPIHIFGVGTELVTSRDDPTLAGVYKLVEQEKDGIVSFKLKLSSEKSTYPGKKQVYRRTDEHGNYLEDIICREKESQIHEVKMCSECRPEIPLIIQVVENGELCYDPPNIEEIQSRTIQNLSYLSDNYKRLENADQYPVHKSLELETLRVSLEDKISHSKFLSF